jgi:hypothetical protein
MLDIQHQKNSEIRGLCKERIEALEHWLRRLIDDLLTTAYGDYFNFSDANGNRIISKKLVEQVESRRGAEPTRYPRMIDAVLLDDAINIICKENLFKQHFKKPLVHAFPDGHVEARTFFLRLLPPRNHLAHANAISVRQAEQVLCYSNDIIESLKQFYRDRGMQQEFNVPQILKVSDSFGNTYTRSQFSHVHDGGIMMQFTGRDEFFLRPGDTLSVEIEVDPTFDPSEYRIHWSSAKGIDGVPQGQKIILPITNRHVAQSFDLQCRVTTNRDWHRLHMGADDFLILYYKVLPPLS